MHVPLKDKTGKRTTNALNNLIEKEKKPERIWSGRAKEFNDRSFFNFPKACPHDLDKTSQLSSAVSCISLLLGCSQRLLLIPPSEHCRQ